MAIRLRIFLWIFLISQVPHVVYGFSPVDCFAETNYVEDFEPTTLQTLLESFPEPATLFDWMCKKTGAPKSPLVAIKSFGLTQKMVSKTDPRNVGAYMRPYLGKRTRPEELLGSIIYATDGRHSSNEFIQLERLEDGTIGFVPYKLTDEGLKRAPKECFGCHIGNNEISPETTELEKLKWFRPNWNPYSLWFNFVGGIHLEMYSFSPGSNAQFEAMSSLFGFDKGTADKFMEEQSQNVLALSRGLADLMSAKIHSQLSHHPKYKLFLPSLLRALGGERKMFPGKGDDKFYSQFALAAGAEEQQIAQRVEGTKERLFREWEAFNQRRLTELFSFYGYEDYNTQHDGKIPERYMKSLRDKYKEVGTSISMFETVVEELYDNPKEILTTWSMHYDSKNTPDYFLFQDSTYGVLSGLTRFLMQDFKLIYGFSDLKGRSPRAIHERGKCAKQLRQRRESN